MRLNLKTKFTLATSLLVLAVVAVVSGLYIGRLTRQVLRQADDRARFVAQQAFLACQNALAEAAERGDAPASLNSGDVRQYVQRTLDGSSTLNALIESAVGYSATIYEITISDRDGIVLVSSDASLRSVKVAMRPTMSSLVHSGFFQQLRTLYGPPQVYEYTLPFNLGPGPFGDVRIGLSSALIRDEISPALESAGYYALGAVLLSTFLAFLVSSVALAPIQGITAQLDRISAGEFDLKPVVERDDELGVVNTKIIGIGKQLRDVREIFSTVRENLDRVMNGLEDGLLLFNAEGRAVLVSPSVAKFIGRKPDELSGRRASEIFPPNDPLGIALQLKGDKIEAIESVEVTIAGASGQKRAGVTAQEIREHGMPMGVLVTLRDVETVESLARIGNDLPVSEQLAVMSRVTSGVAHEVKNPLNSMRLWLEVLKANMPIDPEPQQAVKMLDNEIDRLDRAVKTFLNFVKPVELKIEESNLRALLDEVVEAARPSIANAGVELSLELPPQFPPVLTDRQLIHYAVLNLILNACDFTTRGGRITLGLQRAGDSALISVADSGKGILPEDQKKIFQLFFTTRPGGTGIGLANAFRFVQMVNGRIEFESEVGRGTTFRIELPLANSSKISSGKLRDYSLPFAEEKR
jgi:PAS domain S-box-containing protein